jgi:hypothetical protein
MAARLQLLTMCTAMLLLVVVCQAGESFDDKDDWIATVSDNFVTADFTGFPDGTPITDQYEDIGVAFTDGANFVFGPNDSFPNDWWGLDGNAAIVLSFATAQNWIAADFPGNLRIQTFLGGEQVCARFFIGGGAGHFFGLVSPQPFDTAILTDGIDNLQVTLDDLHFGAGEAFVEFDQDEVGWWIAVNEFAVADGFELGQGTLVTDQYEDLGVIFTDGDDAAFLGDCDTPIDGWGVNGGESIEVQFTTPMRWIAADFLGSVQFDLLSNGKPLYSSSDFGDGTVGQFAGILSTVVFDTAIITSPKGANVTLDDLRFGPAEPGPAPIIDDCNENGIDVEDLTEVILEWSETFPPSPADINDDGIVDVLDLIEVIVAWGPCGP